MCISNMFSGDADVAGTGTTLRESLQVHQTNVNCNWPTFPAVENARPPSEGSGPNLTGSQTRTQKLDRLLLIPALSISVAHKR